MSDAEYIVTLQGIIERERTAALKLADMVKIAHATGFAAGLEAAAVLCQVRAALLVSLGRPEYKWHIAEDKELAASIRVLPGWAAPPPPLGAPASERGSETKG